MENVEITIDEWSGLEFLDNVKHAQSVEGRLLTLEERFNWHRTIGWEIAGVFGAALVLLVT